MPIHARSSSLRGLLRLLRTAHHCDDTGMPTREGLEQARAAERSALTRRRFLGGVGAASALAVTGLARRSLAARGGNGGGASLDVAIVGAGLAGLQCAHELASAGHTPVLYEAASRVGGRQWSLRGVFPGQVAERGGELIDNLHKTMLGWVNTLGLTREDVNKNPGEIAYYFDGARVDEATVVDEYRALVAAMRDDLQACSGDPTADGFTDADRALDLTNLGDYLSSRGAGSNITKALNAAYVAEYGRELDEQSSLNFLLFIHADRRSKFTPFGVYSDERFHVVEGNDRIATGIHDRLPQPAELGLRLERVRKASDGRIELTLRKGSQSVVRTHERVVLAMPFSVLRGITLDANLGLPPWKRAAIDQLGYGDNAKMMIGFDGPYWGEQGLCGASYSDLVNHQATWETNWTLATSERAILTDYAGGIRGKNLDPSKPQLEAGRFLADLDRVMPGALSHASKAAGKYVVHLEHWPSNPLSKGSYTCYLPGQFTDLAGNEGKPVGNLHFAGEHANSFYEWQGFMEGALLSGLDAAAEILG